MTLDFDAALSPASSLPDLLYEFDGQRTPNDDVDEEDDDDGVDHDNVDHVLSNSVFGPDFDWEDSADPAPVEPIPEYTAREEFEDTKKWRIVQISDRTYRIDMEVIEPYKKVLSHGGYYGDGLNAIVVFVACYLPEKSTLNYHYIMDNLFLYVMSTLELLVVQEYMIVYFHSGTTRRRLPGFRWFKRCYDMIDHRLRKSLRGLLVVHPSLILKTILLMMKPFVSSKFSAKVQYVNSLADLTHILPTEYMFIPDEVIQTDRLFSPLDQVPVHKFVNH
jgi:prune family protein 2